MIEYSYITVIHTDEAQVHSTAAAIQTKQKHPLQTESSCMLLVVFRLDLESAGSWAKLCQPATTLMISLQYKVQLRNLLVWLSFRCYYEQRHPCHIAEGLYPVPEDLLPPSWCQTPKDNSQMSRFHAPTCWSFFGGAK